MLSPAASKTPPSQISEHPRAVKIAQETIAEFGMLPQGGDPSDPMGVRRGFEYFLASYDPHMGTDVGTTFQAASHQATLVPEQWRPHVVSVAVAELIQLMAARAWSELPPRTDLDVTFHPPDRRSDIGLQMVRTGVIPAGPEDVSLDRGAETGSAPAAVDNQGGSQAIAAALVPERGRQILREIGEQDVVSRIVELIELRESEPDDEPISLDSLRLASQFVMTAPRYSHPSIAMTEDGLLSFQWRLVPEGMIVMLFRADGLVTYVARVPQAGERADQLRARGTKSLSAALSALEQFERWLPAQ